jgi:hypothetical protein
MICAITSFCGPCICLALVKMKEGLLSVRLFENSRRGSTWYVHLIRVLGLWAQQQILGSWRQRSDWGLMMGVWTAQGLPLTRHVESCKACFCDIMADDACRSHSAGMKVGPLADLTVHAGSRLRVARLLKLPEIGVPKLPKQPKS